MTSLASWPDAINLMCDDQTGHHALSALIIPPDTTHPHLLVPPKHCCLVLSQHHLKHLATLVKEVDAHLCAI